MDNQAIAACIQQPGLISNRRRISLVGSLLDCRLAMKNKDRKSKLFPIKVMRVQCD